LVVVWREELHLLLERLAVRGGSSIGVFFRLLLILPLAWSTPPFVVDGLRYGDG
jgi:hypothetical protein